jgi:hypothetical protein
MQKGTTRMLYKQGSIQNPPPKNPCLYNILVVIIDENNLSNPN